jgi:hypothetical protein
MFAAAVAVLATLVISEQGAAQRPARVIVALQVIDDSLRSGIDDAMITIDGAAAQVTSERGGRYRAVALLVPGTYRLHVRRIGYRMRDTLIVVTGDSALSPGVISLRASLFQIHEDMVVPTCVRVWERPATLRPGTWLTPEPDSAGRKSWRLCDGLRRGI